jgi:hypothetical protein
MLQRRLPVRILFALVTASSLALLGLPGCSSCDKKPPPPVDLTPPAPPPVDAAPVEIKPLDDTPDASDASEPPKPHGTWKPSNPNTARIKLCCNAIRTQAKTLGAAPEAVMMMTIAAQCDQVAVQVGGGSAPEFAQVRQLLKGRTIPNACQGM